MFDDDIMQAAAEVASRYPTGMVPGEHPVEILGGIHRGFTRIQLAAINSDEKLRTLVRRVLDETGTPPELVAIAERDDERGRAHRALLAGLGHPLGFEVDQATIDRAIWAILADAPQALRSKSQQEEEATRWVVQDAHTDADVLVTFEDGVYYVSVVPESGGGEGVLLVRWEGQAKVEHKSVVISIREPLHLQLPSFGRRLHSLAFAPSKDPR